MDSQRCRTLARQSASGTNQAVWRAEMLAGQVRMRQSISELGFLIAGLFLAFLLSEYLPTVSIVVAAAMSAGAMCAVWRDSREMARLKKAMDDEERVALWAPRRFPEAR
jgi:hypothetical protein